MEANDQSQDTVCPCRTTDYFGESNECYACAKLPVLNKCADDCKNCFSPNDRPPRLSEATVALDRGDSGTRPAPCNTFVAGETWTYICAGCGVSIMTHPSGTQPMELPNFFCWQATEERNVTSVPCAHPECYEHREQGYQGLCMSCLYIGNHASTHVDETRPVVPDAARLTDTQIGAIQKRHLDLHINYTNIADAATEKAWHARDAEMARLQEQLGAEREAFRETYQEDFEVYKKELAIAEAQVKTLVEACVMARHAFADGWAIDWVMLDTAIATAQEGK